MHASKVFYTLLFADVKCLLQASCKLDSSKAFICTQLENRECINWINGVCGGAKESVPNCFKALQVVCVGIPVSASSFCSLIGKKKKREKRARKGAI